MALPTKPTTKAANLPPTENTPPPAPAITPDAAPEKGRPGRPPKVAMNESDKRAAVRVVVLAQRAIDQAEQDRKSALAALNAAGARGPFTLSDGSRWVVVNRRNGLGWVPAPDGSETRFDDL